MKLKNQWQKWYKTEVYTLVYMHSKNKTIMFRNDKHEIQDKTTSEEVEGEPWERNPELTIYNIVSL